MPNQDSIDRVVRALRESKRALSANSVSLISGLSVSTARQVLGDLKRDEVVRPERFKVRVLTSDLFGSRTVVSTRFTLCEGPKLVQELPAEKELSQERFERIRHDYLQGGISEFDARWLDLFADSGKLRTTRVAGVYGHLQAGRVPMARTQIMKLITELGHIVDFDVLVAEVDLWIYLHKKEGIPRGVWGRERDRYPTRIKLDRVIAKFRRHGSGRGKQDEYNRVFRDYTSTTGSTYRSDLVQKRQGERKEIARLLKRARELVRAGDVSDAYRHLTVYLLEARKFALLSAVEQLLEFALQKKDLDFAEWVLIEWGPRVDLPLAGRIRDAVHRRHEEAAAVPHRIRTSPVLANIGTRMPINRGAAYGHIGSPRPSKKTITEEED